MKVWIFLLVFLSSLVQAASGGKSAGSYSSSQGISAAAPARGGGGSVRRLDPRKVPPLATDRKVNEQDCSKPIDWQSGNLKCK